VTRIIQVPTRTNSPADVEFADRAPSNGNLSNTATILAATFGASNSVLNGIHPKPNRTTGGEGPVSGEEVEFSVSFATPLDMPAGHYFFVPQVQLSSGNFFWLSGPRPIASPAGTPFTPDLQAWIRNASLDPDWLRVGTDIVGGSTPPTFNGSFALHGNAVCPTVTISPSILPGATSEVAYSSVFSASGDPGPLTFTETGALPAGMGFRADASLSGTPSQEGSFPITVTATSSDGCGASERLTLNVSPPATASSLTKATISVVGETNTVFVVGRASTQLTGRTSARRHKQGTVFFFRLDQPATVKIAIQTKAHGRRVGHLCKPDSRRLRRMQRCTRTITIATLTRIAHAGGNKVAFTGRVGGRALKPGRYTAVFTATDAAGGSAPATLRFTVVER
jgi:hypothetical protein